VSIHGAAIFRIAQLGKQTFLILSQHPHTKRVISFIHELKKKPGISTKTVTRVTALWKGKSSHQR
jgi:hypothetical protein